MTRLVLPDDEEICRTSYPVRRDPRPGESLLSYLLLLDLANALLAGTTLRLIRRYGTGPAGVGRATTFITARSLDLGALATLTGGTSMGELERLTAAPLLRWLFGEARPTLGHPRQVRLCPPCLPISGVRLVFLFGQVDACPDHGLGLVSVCVCGERIQPFGMQEEPGTCHGWGCSRRYADLLAVPASSEVLEKSRAFATIYRELLGQVSGDRRGSQARLRRVLHVRVHASIEDSAERARLSALVRGRFGIASVADVLHGTRTSASELAALLESADGFAPSATARKGGGCPNRACPARGRHDQLVVCAEERQCRECGTRFAGDRILFSFDEVDGYDRWRAAGNSRRLEQMRARVRELCLEWISSDRTITREGILRAAAVPPYSYPHLSPRAGLVATIESARQRQLTLRERDVIEIPVATDERQTRFLHVGHRARIIGVKAACTELGVVRSRYYAWRSRPGARPSGGGRRR